jgi:hypothetical protein
MHAIVNKMVHRVKSWTPQIATLPLLLSALGTQYWQQYSLMGSLLPQPPIKIAWYPCHDNLIRKYISSISRFSVWTPTWNNYWSTSHMWTRYSNNLSWALMPGILKNFNSPQSWRVATVPGSFSMMVSSCSCYISRHSSIVMVKHLHKSHERRVSKLFQTFA